MQLLKSVLFTCILFVAVLVWAPFVGIAGLFSKDLAYGMVVGWVKTIFALLRVLCGLDFSVEGRENIPNDNAVALLKHSSAFETMAQLLIFPRQTWVLKRELMWAPFLGWGLAALKPIAINRSAGSSAVDQVLQQGAERMAEGYWVMVFPEGTRMPWGETRRYGLSGTLLAQHTGVPIVPVAHDAARYWPRRGWLKKPGTVRFVVGRPVPAEGRDPRELNKEIQDWIEANIE